MKNIWKLIVSFLAGVVLLVACKSSPTSNDPNEVLHGFFQHLAKKDIEGAARYVTADSKPTLQMMKKGLEMAEKVKDSLPQKDYMKEFEDVVIEPARVAGDSAFITVKSKSEARPDAEFKLLKQPDGWKVDFTMSTLMRMGMKGAQQHNADSPLPDMNSEEMQKGMKMADSVLKNVDPKILEEIENKLKSLK